MSDIQSLDASFFHLISLFHFLLIYFVFSILRVRVRVMLQSHCHTLDDMVTVMVTSHKAIEKGVEGSEKMTLYDIYYIY